MFRIVAALLAFACLCIPLCSPAFARTKVYYEVMPGVSGSAPTVRYFTKGKRERPRVYLEPPASAAPMLPAATSICPACKRPL